ncbi:Pumilio-like protein [Quillaja saponaria]|uniref:Pumilio-like protein n=1 Tax=Quillaja saponaria TaxID=32244 RepID=A0AAD7LYJ6_QUISA|nr:Pumilio-like protein [Quillaja saponaria]
MEFPDRSLTNSGSSHTLPSVSFGTCVRNSHIRHNVSSETLSQNPFEESHFDQTLESAFSRLSVSPYNESPLYYPFDFVGHIGNGSGSENPVKIFALGEQEFLPRSLQVIQGGNVESQRLGLHNSIDAANVGNMGSGNYWVGSGVESSQRLSSDLYPTLDFNQHPKSNFNRFFTDYARFSRQREDGRDLTLPNGDQLYSDLSRNSCGMVNGLGRKNSTITKSNVNNRRPQWLPEPSNYLSVNDFRGKILSLAKDQYGCRFLQRKMDGLTTEEIDMIFFEVIGHVNELMFDPFGNYVVQKLVEVCSEEQRTQIILMMTKSDFQFVSICLNMHGTRAVQKLLEHVTTQMQISLLMAALSPGAVALTKDMNGHHVIQNCLIHFSDDNNKPLLNEVANNCFEIATDKSGCCVLQQCIEHSRGEIRKHLIAEIIANASLLAEDRYGNYVVQHLLGLRMPDATESLLRQLEGKYVSLSCNKYGSNVVEKCLTELGEQHSENVILELLRSPNVSMLLLDPYGNYVIQSAWIHSKGFIREYLLDLVRQNSPIMRSNLYGKKVLARIEKVK